MSLYAIWDNLYSFLAKVNQNLKFLHWASIVIGNRPVVEATTNKIFLRSVEVQLAIFYIRINSGGDESSNHTDRLFLSLRSKRSRTKRTKFSHSGRAKNGARAKSWKEGGGGGEMRERLPANPLILKNPFAHERGSWLVRLGHLDWQVYQFRLNDSSNYSRVTCTMSWGRFVNLCYR